MTDQQAPVTFRHSCALVAVTVDFRKNQSTIAGTVANNNQSVNSVSKVLSGDENNWVRNQCKAATRDQTPGATDEFTILEASFILSFYQRDAFVIPIHEH